MYGGGAKIRKGETVAESCGRQQRESRGCALPGELPHHTISNSHVGHTSLNPKGINSPSPLLSPRPQSDCATEDCSNGLRTLCSGLC